MQKRITRVLILLAVAVYVAWASGFSPRLALAQVPQNFPNGVVNGCGEQITLSAGTAQSSADCMKNGAQVGLAMQPSAAVTPGNISVNAAVTVTSTGSPSPAATRTVVIINANTANATPVVNWWMIR